MRRCAGGTHIGAEIMGRPQLGLARELCDEEKVREYLWRGAEAYDRCGHLESAEEQLHELLETELSKEQKLEALCFLADVQARAPTFAFRPRCGCRETLCQSSSSGGGAAVLGGCPGARVDHRCAGCGRQTRGR